MGKPRLRRLSKMIARNASDMNVDRHYRGYPANAGIAPNEHAPNR
jgi:hypothetical protein